MRDFLSIGAAAILLALAVACFAFLPFHVSMVGSVGLAVGAALLCRDASLRVTKALPNGAATINTDGIDTGVRTTRPGAGLVAQFELLITAPALTTGELSDASTMKYSIQHDDDAAFGSAVTLAPDVIVQTGAGGAGAAAATFRFRPPSDLKRYIRVRAVKSAAGDASGKSVTAEMCF